MFTLTQLHDLLFDHHLSDIRDKDSLARALKRAEPELVLHLAAQPLVRRSYQQPEETWSTNVMGTMNLLEAVRGCPSVKAVVVITTDKCYDNKEWVWGYRETDPLGGHDPYSASKAGTELVVQSYRKSFFSDGRLHIASARAGNVIGGGDWSEDRLIPDVVRSISAGQPLSIRNPDATRPWQHVLDCLQGYLALAAQLLEGRECAASSFNFGPSASDNLAVIQMLTKLKMHWPELEWNIEKKEAAHAKHEAGYLYLDSSLARQTLHWSPLWGVDEALAKTAQWYRAVLVSPSKAMTITKQQLDEYLTL